MAEELLVNALVKLFVEVNPILFLFVDCLEFVFECGEEVLELDNGRLVGGSGVAGQRLSTVLRTCGHYTDTGHTCLLEGFGHDDIAIE